MRGLRRSDTLACTLRWFERQWSVRIGRRRPPLSFDGLYCGLCFPSRPTPRSCAGAISYLPSLRPAARLRARCATTASWAANGLHLSGLLSQFSTPSPSTHRRPPLSLDGLQLPCGAKQINHFPLDECAHGDLYTSMSGRLIAVTGSGRPCSPNTSTCPLFGVCSVTGLHVGL